MKIPKILHQTWKSESIPPPLKKFMDSWKKYHPSWNHLLWTDEMNRGFIKTHFPDFLSTYDSYTHNIQRVDAVRYFILLHYGGVYIDLDFECLKYIGNILKNETCLLGKEPDEHCKIHNKDTIISNAFIACTANHNFIKAVCDEISFNRINDLHKNNYILESTGPFMITRVYKRIPEEDRPVVLSFEALYPLTKDEIQDTLSGKEKSEAIQNKLNNAYAVHYYWGSWWKNPYTSKLY